MLETENRRDRGQGHSSAEWVLLWYVGGMESLGSGRSVENHKDQDLPGALNGVVCDSSED